MSLAINLRLVLNFDAKTLRLILGQPDRLKVASPTREMTKIPSYDETKTFESLDDTFDLSPIFSAKLADDQRSFHLTVNDESFESLEKTDTFRIGEVHYQYFKDREDLQKNSMDAQENKDRAKSSFSLVYNGRIVDIDIEHRVSENLTSFKVSDNWNQTVDR